LMLFDVRSAWCNHVLSARCCFDRWSHRLDGLMMSTKVLGRRVWCFDIGVSSFKFRNNMRAIAPVLLWGSSLPEICDSHFVDERHYHRRCYGICNWICRIRCHGKGWRARQAHNTEMATPTSQPGSPTTLTTNRSSSGNSIVSVRAIY
jgi:hypothetical protein